MLLLNPTYLLQSTHSRNFLSNSNLPISFFLITKTLFSSELIIVLLILAFHFVLDLRNNCFSTLMALTDTHSHHNLTTHILYPICTLRDRIQISWLFNMHIAIINAKNLIKNKGMSQTLYHYILHQNNKLHGPNSVL